MWVFWLLLCVSLGFLIILLPALWTRALYRHYAGSRAVVCPETGRQVSVSLDATHAALTGLRGPADLRLADCSRWPERWKCNRDCIPQAVGAEPYRRGEVQTITKRIYHLPVLLAAFAAWYLGAFWHSHFLFRSRWMADLGLTPMQVKELVSWLSPHLLSVAVWILFAYGVAWLMALQDRRGVIRGIGSGVFLWLAVVLGTWPVTRGIPQDLWNIEAAYSLLAVVLVGAIVGGLSGRLVLDRGRPVQKHEPVITA